MLYLFLNDISTGEVIVILIFVLMFFGSKSIPGMARTLGRTMRQIRDATDEIKRDIRNSAIDIEKEFEDVGGGLKKNAESISKGLEGKTKDLENIAKKFKSTLESAGEEKRAPRKPIREKYGVTDRTPEIENKAEEPAGSGESKNAKMEVSPTPEGKNPPAGKNSPSAKNVEPAKPEGT